VKLCLIQVWVGLKYFNIAGRTMQKAMMWWGSSLMS
jgi:hypothetical protein